MEKISNGEKILTQTLLAELAFCLVNITFKNTPSLHLWVPSNVTHLNKKKNNISTNTAAAWVDQVRTHKDTYIYKIYSYDSYSLIRHGITPHLQSNFTKENIFHTHHFQKVYYYLSLNNIFSQIPWDLKFSCFFISILTGCLLTLSQFFHSNTHRCRKSEAILRRASAKEESSCLLSDPGLGCQKCML